MEGKRKASGPPFTPDGEQRSAKRTKLPAAYDPSEETPETTKEVGLKLMDSIKNAKDKTGRQIGTEFLTLPDRDLFPDYYKEIRLPIAMDTIEAKLERSEYPNMTALESDFKRMITNAKLYNDKRSPIYEDAERLRKTAFNFFVRYNPAYRDPTYQAVATPIPDDADGANPPTVSHRPSASSEAQATPIKAQTPATASPAPSVAKTKSADPSADTSGENGDSSDFVGKTFMQAQDKLLEELIHYTDEDGELEIFTPFVNLPPRHLLDYYQVIKHPVSLKGVQRKVRGIHGRSAPTWKTDFKSWDAFEQEVSYIWQNAREYNEDGSEIFELAGELEQVFRKRLADAKAVVEQPPQPKLKINAPAAPKIPIKLNFNRSAQSPSTTSGPATPAESRSTPGVIVDNEALARQQKMVAAATNGQMPQPTAGAAAASSRTASVTARTPSASTPVPTPGPRHQSNTTQPAPTQANGIKRETSYVQSPGLTALRPATQTSHPQLPVMPPPSSLTPRPSSGSPHPQGPLSHPPAMNQYHPLQHASNGPLQSLLENKRRPPEQKVADYILPSLSICTHPQLQLSAPFRVTVPASNTLTQQSVTVTVPATHYYVQIIPYIPVALTGRPYRVFVLVNGHRQSELVKPGVERDKQRPLFEARLERGFVNRIEVEVLAGKEKKNSSGKEDVEMEKCTVFMHVMR